MRHWLQLATRNWRTRAGRSALAVVAITLGVAVVVWVTCCYESVRRGVTDVVLDWIGRSHVVIESRAGVWGTINEEVRDWVKDVPGIAMITTRTREYVEAAPPPDPSTTTRPAPGATIAGEPATPDSNAYVRIEVTGIVPREEEGFRNYNISEGRMLRQGDRNSVVMEKLLARRFNLSVGDKLFLRHKEQPNPAHAFTIVGILDRRRASMNQAFMVWAPLHEVQSLCKLPGLVKSVEIIAQDPSSAEIGRIAKDVEAIIAKKREAIRQTGDSPPSIEVRTTAAQLKKLGAAQGLLQFIMLLLACVVLLTAFFIIIATMSMGVTERVAELGLLRCVGVTRWQLCRLIILQTAPLGVLGTVLGIPIGLALQWLTMHFVPDYLGSFAISIPGLWLAAIGGIGTTLLGAVFPAIRAFEVSPVEAVRSPGDPNAARWVWLSTGVGVVMLVAHEVIARSLAAQGHGMFDAKAIASIVLLYLGAALLVPLIVILFGKPAVRIAGRLLGLRHELLGDEIHKAPFRSASICSGLMVGLSLIVGLIVWGESVKAGWQFPSEFPDALLYFYEPRPLDKVRELSKLEGVAAMTVTDDIGFSLRKPQKQSSLLDLFRVDPLQRFIAIDPDEGFNIVKLTFLEGDEETARAKLKQGGFILVTREFAAAYRKGIGDRVRIWVEGMDGTRYKLYNARFEIAGVIASPGLDIAISFFAAESYFQSYAVGAMVGTLEDAKKHFNREFGKLVLFNFDPAMAVGKPVTSDDLAPEGIPGTATTKTGRPTFALSGKAPLPGDTPEIHLVNEMLKRMDYPDRAFVTARELKRQIDENINRVTLLLSAVPFVGLIIAALGLANLMAANVSSRSRHLAVLRAIGITKSQLVRMVVGEGLVLAIIGSSLGLLLGIVLGRTSNFMTELLSGFRPEFAIPWTYVTAGALLSTALCILAALGPAHYAGRSNIVSALQD